VDIQAHEIAHQRTRTIFGKDWKDGSEEQDGWETEHPDNIARASPASPKETRRVATAGRAFFTAKSAKLKREGRKKDF
jgi:hypothetical protein